MILIMFQKKNVTAKPKEFMERTIGFTINYKREDKYDPRELSEFPDIRLWFVRLDATYPWLPILLDWRAGELARYAAMLVPHQVYNSLIKFIYVDSVKEFLYNYCILSFLYGRC